MTDIMRLACAANVMSGHAYLAVGDLWGVFACLAIAVSLFLAVKWLERGRS